MFEMHCIDNLLWMTKQPSSQFDLIYLDPPYNTGKIRRDIHGTYDDSFEDYIYFLKPRIQECFRLLKPYGSIFIQTDYRECHYVKIMMDEIFSRQCFQNEIIWSYDYGGRSKSKWSAKHDNIFWYSKHPKKYTYNYDSIDRIPYLAPSLVGPEKAAKGKTPTDVWWMTIEHTQSKQRTGYPTQKPMKLLERIIRVHTNPKDKVLDCFAGSGTTAFACKLLDRECVLVDNNIQAHHAIKKRLSTI